MKNRALITTIGVLTLVSCTARKSALPPITSKPVLPPISVPVKSMPAISQPISMPPKINTIDWQSSLAPLVQQMLEEIEGINDESVLLIHTMKNATNGSIQTSKATEILSDMIASSSRKFQIIDAKQLNIARRALGIAIDNSLESRSEAVGIARYLNAQYVLYSVANGDVEQPKFDLQLILVKTGEIIWSGNGITQS